MGVLEIAVSFPLEMYPQMELLDYIIVLFYLFIYFFYFRERGEAEQERDRDMDLLFYLFMHSLVGSCMALTQHRTCNLGVWG